MVFTFATVNPVDSIALSEYFFDQLILNTSLSVDVFYVIRFTKFLINILLFLKLISENYSATLLVLLWMKDAKKTAGRHVGNVARWSMMIVHRYIRYIII